LAVGSNSLFYVDGSTSGPHTLYELNPDTGAVLDADVVDAASPSEIDGLFSEPVIGFDLADLALTRNGGGVSLLTTAQTLTSGDGLTWTLGHLAGLTGTGGTYGLTLRKAAVSGITDVAGNPLAGDASDSWISTAPALVDDGAPGYSQVGAWTTVVGFGGVSGDLSFAAAGDGSATASWQLALVPGAYDVQVTWISNPNRASDAPGRLYEGSTLLQTVRVDQRQAPAGSSVGGMAYQSLGVVTLTTGPLRVVLGNDADGYVIADAVRVAPPAGASAALAGADLLRDIGGPERVPLDQEEILQVSSGEGQAPLISAVRSVTSPVTDLAGLDFGRRALALGASRSIPLATPASWPASGAGLGTLRRGSPGASPLILPGLEQGPGRRGRIGRTRRDPSAPRP
jgi:hypothetical protein